MRETSKERWFYGTPDGRKGPVSRDVLVDLLLCGELPESTLVWYSGLPDWRPASEVPDLRREFPPPLPSGPRNELPAAVVDDEAFGDGPAASDETTPSEGATPEAEHEADASGAAGESAGEADDKTSDGEAADAARSARKKRNRHRRHHRKAEERYVVVPRDQKKLLLWAWPLLVLAGIIVWLLLLRANRTPPESPAILPPVSSLG